MEEKRYFAPSELIINDDVIEMLFGDGFGNKSLQDKLSSWLADKL